MLTTLNYFTILMMKVIAEEIFFTFHFGIRIQAFATNKLTHYLLDHGDYRYADFTYFIWMETRPLLLDRLFLFKIIVFKLKLTQLFRYTDFRIYFALLMGGAMRTIVSSPIFVQNIYIVTVVNCTKFKISCCYIFFNKPILLAYNGR